MSPAHTTPFVWHDGYLVMCSPESDLDGLQRFHFSVKRTCVFAPDGRAEPADRQQRPLAADRHFEEGDPFTASVQQASELGPPLGGTDVAVIGHACAPGGEATHFYPSVQVGSHRHRILAIGDRVAVIDREGRAHISPPQPFHVRPVRYEYAYGGVDHQCVAAPVPCLTNPLGTGFVLGPLQDAEPREAWTPMPNFEHPDQLLDRDSLRMPATREQPARRPAGFGWIAPTWAPRAQMAGLPESTRRLWQRVHGDTDPEGTAFRPLDPAYWRAANPGLQCPLLGGDEGVVLTHLHQTHESLRFRLPGLRPALRVALNGEAAQAVPVQLSMVHVEVDEQCVQLVWRGTLPRPAHLEGLHALTRMEYEVDGRPVLPAALVGTGFPIELMRGELPAGVLNLAALDRLAEVQR